MDTIPRGELISGLQETFQTIIETYDIDEVGIFEEEGQDNHYFLGYSVKKDDKAYMIHQPYEKQGDDGLQPINQGWTIETDEPNAQDKGEFSSLDDAMNEIL